MRLSPFNRARLACAYFFAVPGVVYGILTSRMPAIKSMVNANDGEIGILLLAFGAACFCGLLMSGKVLAAWGVRFVLGFTALALPLALTIAGLALNYWQLMIFCVFGGLFNALCEVAMNANGMMIEKRYQARCMSGLHACYSVGGMAGALSGSLCAYLNLSPAINFLIVSGAYALLWPLAYGNVEWEKMPFSTNTGIKDKARVPLFIYLCGILTMLAYASEGSVGEWGSILMHSIKGAPQDEAALVFGFFCAAMVIFRFLGDTMRGIFSDAQLVFFGGLLSGSAMTVVLLCSSTSICLAAYMVMGIGFAPIVPIFFSRAGQCGGVSLTRASTTLSTMSYTGLLVFPPFLGMLGDSIGLDRALWVITGACICIAFGGGILLRKDRKEQQDDKRLQ